MPASASTNAPVQMLVVRREAARASFKNPSNPADDGSICIAPVTTTVSYAGSPNGCVAISTPAELRTMPPCSEMTSTSYSGCPASRLASSNTEIATISRIWKPGKTTTPTRFIAMS